MVGGTKLAAHIDPFNLIVSELVTLDEHVKDEKKTLFVSSCVFFKFL